METFAPPAQQPAPALACLTVAFAPEHEALAFWAPEHEAPFALACFTEALVDEHVEPLACFVLEHEPLALACFVVDWQLLLPDDFL